MAKKMAKKKKSKTPYLVIKFIIVGLLSLVVGFFIYKGAADFIIKTDYFKIKSVIINSSLQFIDKRDFARVKGRNIFLIDLKNIERKLRRKYPQVSQLKVVRHFPGQIEVIAKKRLPFAQISVKEKILTLDEYGRVLSTTSRKDKKIPFISGLKIKDGKPFLGTRLGTKGIQSALTIIKAFRKEKMLSSYFILEIDAGNLSKIKFDLSNSLKIIIDLDKINRRMRILGVLLSRADLDVDKIKYVDLRFKEPIIGKK